jgi:pimeloyl-ACP methyl ester carboxylesterase
VWEQTLPVIARGGFRAIAYDQPGFGLSDNPKDYGGAYRTQFIVKFIEAMGIERPVLVGHSQAGRMAVNVALKQPGRVRGVVVIGCGSLLPPLPEQGRAGGGGEGQEGTPSEPTLEDIRRLLENNLFDKSFITQEVLEKRHRMSVGKNFTAFIERSKIREAQKQAVPAWKRLEDISVPLLMLYGRQDRGSAAKKCALLKEQAPKLQLELVDNASHLLMWDAREKFNERLLSFLSAL